MTETGAKFPIGPTLPRARELNMAYRAVIRLVDGDEAPGLEGRCEYAPGPIGCGDEAPELEGRCEYAPGPMVYARYLYCHYSCS